MPRGPQIFSCTPVHRYWSASYNHHTRNNKNFHFRLEAAQKSQNFMSTAALDIISFWLRNLSQMTTLGFLANAYGPLISIP